MSSGKTGWYRVYPDDLPPWLIAWAMVDRTGYHVRFNHCRYPFCTVCSFRVPPDRTGDTPLYQLAREEMSKFIKKAVVKFTAAGPGPVPKDPDFAKEYPAAWEFLSLDKDDNKPRQTATMTMWVQDGMWKLSFNDRETNLGMFLTAPTFAKLLAVLEAALVCDDPPWRTRQQDGSTSRRKGGK